MMDFSNLKWTLIRTFVNTRLAIIRSPWYSPQTQPNYTKVYPCRPYLFAARIFLPKSQDGQPPQNLPLIVRLHGGAFLLNNPAADDHMARHLADNANCCVVSIDYSKAPHCKFPTGYEDVIALSQAVIDDDGLPIDRSKVVLCGNSAGGNLAFGTAQDPRLRPKILGLVGVYPLLDLVPERDAKMATRPDPTVPDFLADSYAGVMPLYLDEQTKPEVTDVRLSPTYFSTRSDLPENVLIVGVEHDMLCHEAKEMAEKLAGDSKRAEKKAGWLAQGVRWYKLLGQPHAFESFPQKDAEKEKARLEAIDELYGVLCQWLRDVCSEGVAKL